MFLGHFAVALAAKPAAPRASLGTLVLAAQFADRAGARGTQAMWLLVAWGCWLDRHHRPTEEGR